MSFEPGGMADKLGNRYEGRWIVRQLLMLLAEQIQSVTVELIGPSEQGVDLLVVKNGIRQLQQCKARAGSKENWSVADLKSKGILSSLKNHLINDPQKEFALISPIPAQGLADICLSARISNNNPSDFYQYQIQDLGQHRQDLFQAFCNATDFDPSKEQELSWVFNILQRSYFDTVPDGPNAKSDLLLWADMLLTGKPDAAFSALLTYAENDKYREAIYVDELRNYLAQKHGIYPKQLQHDERIGPAIENLQDEFFNSINPGLIGNSIIPRKETEVLIECIENGRDVVIHGAAGFGKSGVLYELTKYLEDRGIPFIPIRLDRRIPAENAKLFGENLGLPESPAYCLGDLAADRKSVLILDQLDAIRWTASHSTAAMNVCRELIRQVRSLRRTGKNLVMVFACRTFDLENDPEIKNLLSQSGNPDFAKVQIGEFSDEQLKKILREDIENLTLSQKRILSIPQNLSMWLQLKRDGERTSFQSPTELMRNFWDTRRQILEREAKISHKELDDFLNRLIDYIENNGEISAPDIYARSTPIVRNALISYGILQQDRNRISFCHQRYLDYLIAERVLLQIYDGNGSLLDWLGSKEKQSLFRREQLRQVLNLLSSESLIFFFAQAKLLLESENIRFHIKHLILEIIGQLDEIPEEIGQYIISMIDDGYWEEHIQGVVFLGHPVWISYLLKKGIIPGWLRSSNDRRINRALLLLHSVSVHIPDQVTEILIPFVNAGEPWLKHALNTICWNTSDDSEQMFELRLRLMRQGYVKNLVDWVSLCDKYPPRAIRLAEVIIASWQFPEFESENDDPSLSSLSETRLVKLYDHDLEALSNAAQVNPIEAWDLLMPHVERLTNIRPARYDRRLELWDDEYYAGHETHIARGIVRLLILSGQALAAHQTNEFLQRTLQTEHSISSIVQRIIVESYACLPATHADRGIKWLLADENRFHLGSGHNNEPEWMPAVRLIAALSPHCSEELFQKLENSIIHCHPFEEKREAKYYLKGWQNGHFGHFWGKLQYFLLPALDPKRINPSTVALIKVLQRKFAPYSSQYFLKSSMGIGGFIGSKLDPNLEKISDRTWLRVISNEKVIERRSHKWIQLDNDHVLEASISQFASSLSRISKRFPERFANLALQFRENIHPSYASAIIDGLSQSNPGDGVPELEREAWEPAKRETIELVLNKFQADDTEFATHFCWLIANRPDENWSNNTIARLVHYAQTHPDLPVGKLNIHSDKDSDDVTVGVLLQNTINCVRGVAAHAIGKILRKHADWLGQVQPGIESLVKDFHPVVRMASLESILPVLNIDKNLAVQWFLEACNNDLRIPASHHALNFFNYTIPSHIDQVGPLIQKMVNSPVGEVAYQGARQATARWIFHGYFEKEFNDCCTGTIHQRKGVADVAVYLFADEAYSYQCQDILIQLMNDPEKDVRSELLGIFGHNNMIKIIQNQPFVKSYVKSLLFSDGVDRFLWRLNEYKESLVPVADALFIICDEFSTTLREKTRDVTTEYHFATSELISILLRLYEQAQGENNRDVANRCLDIWDLFFENRVGRTIELTKAIDR